MANSRDLVRSDTLLAPWLSGCVRRGARGSQFLRSELEAQSSHLNSGEARFKTFVAALQAGAIDGLFKGYRT